MLGTFYHQKCWKMTFAKHIAEELRTRSFFKRFKADDLIKFLPLMKVKQHKMDSVLFPDFDVCIILDGLVESKFHNAGDRIPKPLAKYRQGDILGYL
jgi:galactokinase